MARHAGLLDLRTFTRRDAAKDAVLGERPIQQYLASVGSRLGDSSDNDCGNWYKNVARSLISEVVGIRN